MSDAGVVVVSSISLTVSIAAFGISTYKAKKLDRRNLLLKVHEKLVEPEQQRGRKHLFNLYDKALPLETLTDEQVDEAYQALAVLDVVGYYCYKNYVEPKSFLELWARPIYKLKYAAQPVIARRNSYIRGTWPYFAQLTEMAEERLNWHGVNKEELRRPQFSRDWDAVWPAYCRARVGPTAQSPPKHEPSRASGPAGRG